MRWFHVSNRVNPRKSSRIRGNHRYNIYYYVSSCKKIEDQTREIHREIAKYKAIRILSHRGFYLYASDSAHGGILRLSRLLLRSFARFASILYRVKNGDEE
ncbi:hypothetical protein [Sulfolobus spindle-shaped virus]|nr:hypothetical protein [Sulfolobus spindle-shaped virus]QGA87259.1 hypothetical protein [Sulfolobus spindle-shaped virus]QGA87285.1 hypothetical protein [Sulfolobus spindle-shaped virus]